MPILTTIGAASARTLGLTSNGGMHATVTFPAGSSSWTCPPGVTKILTLSLAGGLGRGSWTSYSADWYLAEIFTNYPFEPGLPTASTATTLNDVYTLVTNEHNRRVAAITATAAPGVQVNLARTGKTYFKNYPSTGQLESGDITYPTTEYYYKSSPGLVYGGITATSTRVVDVTTDMSAYSTGLYRWDAHAGAASTAFGYSAAGGSVPTPTDGTTSGAQQIVNNIAVTPGTVYPINVASDAGSVTISY